MRSPYKTPAGEGFTESVHTLLYLVRVSIIQIEYLQGFWKEVQQ